MIDHPAVLLLVGLAATCGLAAVILLSVSWLRARRRSADEPMAPRRPRPDLVSGDPIIASLDLEQRRQARRNEPRS